MSKKIKVIRIIARLNVGGPARHVILLAEELDKTRYDTMLIYGKTARGEGDMSYLAKDKIWSLYLPELSRDIDPIGDICSLVKLYFIMRRERPHIVHTHTSKAGILGRIAAILARVPIKVHTFHGHIFYGYFNKLLTRSFLLAERNLAHLTDRIIAISQNQKYELLNKYSIGTDKRYSVINLGLDLERFLNADGKKGAFRKRYRFEGDDILVGIVGRLAPIKNHRMFIRVAHHLKSYVSREIFEKVKFIIIGDGSERAPLVDYVRSKDLQSNVVFTGWIKDIEEVYADLDIVTLTSRNEGTPLSLIEAFASSKPVISTDVGGVRDVLGEIGILVERDDEASFAQALSEFILSPHRREEVGSMGREYIMKKFLKGNLVGQVEKLYEDLLSAKGIAI